MLNLIAYVWGVDAPKEKPHGAQHTEGPANNSTAILPATDSTSKSFATLAARAALLGHTFQRHGNIFLIGRWGHTREFDSLAKAAQWLDQIGSKR